jgi:catechol 2,3-dioxygenase-like lactoylglutathione lyase family enzyme
MRVNALILWTTAYDRTVAFYRALGVPLVDEQHDDGPLHVACELDGVHVAIYPAEGSAAVGYRTGGGAMLGFTVPAIDPILAALAPPIVRAPEAMPWGRRVVIADPDGRAVELTEQ